MDMCRPKQNFLKSKQDEILNWYVLYIEPVFKHNLDVIVEATHLF